jgi:hypothetical protein
MDPILSTLSGFISTVKIIWSDELKEDGDYLIIIWSDELKTKCLGTEN